MDYVKANYERLLLLLSGLLLVAVAFYAVSSFSALESEFQTAPPRDRGAEFAANETLARLQSESGKLAAPSDKAWEERDLSLFVSRVYLLRDGQLVDIVDSQIELIPGIPNDWLLKHELDYTDAEIAQRDPDADKFSNMEEFSAGTNPRDASSTPPLWTKLRVKSFEKIPFRLKFMGAPSLRPGEPFDENTEFSINTLDYSSPTQFLKVGQKIAGSELQITKAEAKSATNQVGATVDISELTLEDASTGDTVILVNEKEVDSPYSYALLQNTINGEEIRVEKGKMFTLGPDAISYKLIDVGSEGAVISPSESAKELLKVPLLQAPEGFSPEKAQ
jgi:hypothetical protein